MFVLFTDFGVAGPYLGQMKSVLLQRAPGLPIIDLFADAPTCNPRAAAYLLASYVGEFPPGSVFLAVVDPGVGTDQREPVVLEADGRWFVGPGNGLFELLRRRAERHRCWSIAWRPERLSASFHGRDLFAPIAARIALGDLNGCRPSVCGERPDWPDDLAEAIYVDHFGNVMTGLRGRALSPEVRIAVGHHELAYAPTFGAMPVGQAFWYENANGLVELAVNQGRAADHLGLRVGDPVQLLAS